MQTITPFQKKSETATALKLHPSTPQLPAIGFLREHQIIGNPKAKPPIPAIIPISRTAWREGIKAEIYPKPVSLGEGKRTIAWRVEDILQLIERLGKSEVPEVSK